MTALMHYREFLAARGNGEVSLTKADLWELRNFLANMSGRELSQVLREDSSPVTAVREAELREALARIVR